MGLISSEALTKQTVSLSVCFDPGRLFLLPEFVLTSRFSRGQKLDSTSIYTRNLPDLFQMSMMAVGRNG